MNYARQESQLLAEAFRAARNRLTKKGMRRFICNALQDAYLASEITNWQLRHARHEITVRMDYAPDLESWLRVTHKVPTSDLIARNTHQYRLAWLDALIEEFSK